MSDRKTGSLPDAYARALVALGEADASLVVVDGELPGAAPTFRERFPERFVHSGVSETTIVPIAAGLAVGGRAVFASTSSPFIAGRSYHQIRQSICHPRAPVKIVAVHGGRLGGEGRGPPEAAEDLGLMRGLPGMTVICPADAPTAEAATRAVHAIDGPAYIRLAGESLPNVTDGSFEIGRAAELRPGSDLTIVAVGALVARALDVAEEFHRVGVEVRVLDLASVKPFDEKALLKAARETGAILTMEEHTVLTGIGALVASTTSEEYPVPVRRMGIPDVFGEPAAAQPLLDRYGMSKERCVEEGYELLRLRGKVQ